MPSTADQELFAKALRWFEEDRNHHYRFVQDVERNYRSYRGLLEESSEAAGWHTRHHPAYAFQVIETLVAGIVDPSPRWRLRARPKLMAPAKLEQMRIGAKAHENLLGYQLEIDHFAEKQRPRDLQGFIAGLTVTQQSWGFEEGIARRLQVTHEPMQGPLGMPMTRPVLREVSEKMVLRDGPTSEVVDVRDFIWPESAVSIARAPRLTRRHWFTFDELLRQEAAGLVGPKVGGESVETLRESQDQSTNEGVYDREQILFNVNRTKGLIEVLEMWIEGGRRVVSIGNRKVLLGVRDNPHWFERLEHRYPFVVCSGAPDLFRIPGISEIEVIRELQEMAWNLGNQRLDTLRLINNAVVIVPPEYGDDFEIFPGAVNEAEDPTSVQMWSPNIQLANVSLEAEAQVKADLQNIPGASPVLLGQTDASTQTATEVSLLTNLAQRRLAAKKQQYVWAGRRVGEQWSALNQQFIRTNQLIEVVGTDGELAYDEVRPEVLDGDYVFSTEMVDESMMRQERRAEATSKLQVALNGAQVMAALTQGGAARMINLDAFWEDYLDAFDISDTEKYFTTAKPAPPPAPGQQTPGEPPGPGGITAPQANDLNSPSNEFSQSPVAAVQRLLAMAGGGNNAPS